MSENKIKDMGNLSRASDEMRKKLELSFTPQPISKPTNQNTEVNKSVNPEINKATNTEVPISGKVDFKPTSINTEIHKSVQDDQNIAVKVGSRYKKITPRAANTLKAKATFCLDMVAVEQLNMIYIKRLSSHQKSDRSSLICEAISLLFEKEKLL